MTARAKTGALAATLAAATLVIAACGTDEPGGGTVPSGSISDDRTPAKPEVSVNVEPESTKPSPPMTLPATTDPPTTPPSDPGAGVPNMDDAARDAIRDLAGRIGADPSTITVVADERVTWRDGSIGCPKPGMAYTQALVPGRRLILASSGQTYAYHAGRAGALTYCATPDPGGPLPSGPGTDT
ncbi:MAG: hypothetical protein H0X61_08065 [Acidimicrobiia bacterium]|jgi:hypothetical protein|nr:hypothetical protein [Acidimicrobiia bacterium]